MWLRKLAQKGLVFYLPDEEMDTAERKREKLNSPESLRDACHPHELIVETEKEEEPKVSDPETLLTKLLDDPQVQKELERNSHFSEALEECRSLAQDPNLTEEEKLQLVQSLLHTAIETPESEDVIGVAGNPPSSVESLVNVRRFGAVAMFVFITTMGLSKSSVRELASHVQHVVSLCL